VESETPVLDAVAEEVEVETAPEPKPVRKATKSRRKTFTKD